MPHSNNLQSIHRSINFLFVIVAAAIAFSCNKANLSTPAKQTQNMSSSASQKGRTSLSSLVQTARAGVAVSPHINGYYEALPGTYASTTKSYPLLICLHGVGEVGNGTTSLPSLLKYGPAKMINDGTFPSSFTVDGTTYEMMVMTPQLTQVGMFPTDLDAFIDYCKSHYRVDASRVYLAGLSMGGAEVWHSAGYNNITANKITAMVPMCSWTTPDSNYQVTAAEAQTIAAANIKIWQTHCYNDPTAMFSWSVAQADLVESSVPAPNPLPKITSFNSNSHDAWTTTYDPNYTESGLNIYQWMLHYSRGTTSSAIPPQVPITQMITFKGSNNLYVHNAGDGSALTCNATTFTLWEGFVVVSASGGKNPKVAFQNQGSYITCANPSTLYCTASTIGTTEQFRWIFNTDGTSSFQGSNGKYISNINGSLSCLASTIGTNEKFRIDH